MSPSWITCTQATDVAMPASSHRQGFGDVHVSEALCKVLVMEGFHGLDMRLQCFPQVARQDGRPVLTAPDKYEVLTEVHVLDAQAEARQQAQATAIEQPRHEGVPACHGGEQPLDFRLGEHGGWPWSAFAAGRSDGVFKGHVRDIAVEKHQGVQGLPLGGGRHLAFSGEVGEKALHLRGPEPVRMGLAAAVTDVAKNPEVLGLLSAVGVAIRAEHLAHLIHPREAGIRAKLRCSFILTFHNLEHNITIHGNSLEKMQYMDSKQLNFLYLTLNIILSGKSVHL
jgi:hypothetical protein